MVGIADQLQTNFACDLRHILKAVFDSNTSCEASPKVVAKAVTGFNELDNLSPVVPNPSSVVSRAGGNEFTGKFLKLTGLSVIMPENSK